MENCPSRRQGWTATTGYRVPASYVDSTGEKLARWCQLPRSGRSINEMGRGKRNPGCRCCPGCPTTTDDFNRGDSTSVGANYTEQAGDWEISSNKLTTTDTDAILLATTPVHRDQVVSVKIEGSAGDKAGIISSWLDANNYVFTEVTLGATTSTVKVWRTRSGSTVQVNSDHTTPGIRSTEQGVLQVCYYSPSSWHTWFAAPNQDARSVEAFRLLLPPNGEQWGLATGDTNGGSILFDDLTFARHRP